MPGPGAEPEGKGASAEEPDILPEGESYSFEELPGDFFSSSEAAPEGPSAVTEESLQAVGADGDSEPPATDGPPEVAGPARGREPPVTDTRPGERSGSESGSRRGQSANGAGRGTGSSPDELAERLAEDPAFAAVREVFPGRVVAIESAPNSAEEGAEPAVVAGDDIAPPEDD